MDVLHLTDLHVTEPNTSLDEVWSTAFDQLRAADRETFDFIVVSGDLTQKADPAEYKQLTEFTRSELIPRLRDPKDRRRIVFVPGNHDVDWGHKDAHRKPSPPITEKQIAELLGRPHLSPLRAKITKAGELEIVERHPDEHPKRFTNVQNFLNEFYGPVGGKDRNFDLVSKRSRDHWSAHVFDNVAFFGFNSCFHNDGYWRGATLEEDAVTAAVAHARTTAPSLLWVAVWHHGLASDRGNPDHLITRDLGRLRAAGFRVGIHGHTHVDEFGDVRDVLGERFPIVATGSFAAGPSERPEGTLNQFSVLELSPTYLVIDRYERRPTTRWQRRRLVPYVLRDVDGTKDTPFNDAEEHRRSFVLDPRDGFARVTIELTNLEARRELVLGNPAGPYSNLIPYPVHADGEMTAVVQDKGPDGRDRIRFTGSSGRYKSMTWSCVVSNALASDRADLVMRGRADELGKRMHDDGWAEWDWITHRALIHCRALTLSLNVPTTDPFFDEVSVRAFDENDQAKPAESARITPIVNEARTHIHARIERPLVGYRYVLGYRPRSAGRLIPSAVRTMLSNLSELLRGGFDDDPVRSKLTTDVEVGLRTALQLPEDARSIVWYAYLWNHRRQRLEVCFGRCPWWSSGTEFEYGKGVVGHAFRTRSPASYFAADDIETLILEGTTPFDWIVAVPILLEPDGPAVGVVAFAGRDSRGWDRDLRDYARGVADAQRSANRMGGEAAGEADPRARQLEQRLVQASTFFFWCFLIDVCDSLGTTDSHVVSEVHRLWINFMTSR